MKLINKEWLERILNKNEKEGFKAKVKLIIEEDVVEKGDNYGSEMTRLKVEMVLDSGEFITKFLIMKSMPEHELRVKQLEEWGFFENEIKVYKEVLPLMEKLMKEVGETNGALWSQCLDYVPSTRIVFQDLKALGYKMCDKRRGLDLKHATLAFKSLGKFHALSVILKERDVVDLYNYKDLILTTDSQTGQAMHDKRLKSLANVVENHWGKECKIYADKIRGLIGNSFAKTIKEITRDDAKFNVFNHGDFWLNNMLFKYGENIDDPISVRFVDYQMCKFNQPGIDLQYVYSTSFSEEMKRDHTNELLGIYHKSLIKWLRMLGFHGEEPSLEYVRQSMHSFGLYGFVISMYALPLMLSDPDDVPDHEQFLKEIRGISDEETDSLQFLGKHYQERMKSNLKYYAGLGII